MPQRKTVLITGASGNLGKIVVARFLQENYHIIAITRSPPSDLPASVEHYQADLSSEKDAAQIWVQLKNRSLHAALFLAGGFTMAGLSETDQATLHSMISTNFESAFYLSRCVIEKMMNESGGRILFIGARPVIKPEEAEKVIPYALSKSLLFSLAEYYNAIGRKHNVITCVIVPGTINTPSNRDAMPDADQTHWVSPEDLADAMVYLCSEKGNSLHQPVWKMFG
jgi:NAD(P)-dependent dehydrogenase (short-subunit alcohol dehydrogenase family)